MATDKDSAPARAQSGSGGTGGGTGAGIRGVEARSIDWVPDSERHGKVWHQAPL